MEDINKKIGVINVENEGEKPKEIVRYRTIHGVAQYIHELDPESAITTNMIRNMCKNGSIKCTAHGNRWLIDLDDFIDKLNSCEIL